MKHTIAAAFLLASTAIVAPASAETELSFNIFFPPTHYSWPVFQKWSDDISAATNGDVKITFPAQSVAPPPGVMDAVRNGVVDGGFIFNGFIAKAYPATLLSQMPWMHKGDSAAISVQMWENYQQHFADKEPMRGVHLASLFNLGPAYLCSVTDTPITSMEDLKSRRIWALPGTIANTMKDMDLSIVSGPAVQVQELTSRNTVDAHFGLTAETVVSFGVAPYTKSCVSMIPSMQSANFSVFFNQRAWDKLTDAQRAAITDLSGSALAQRLGEATNEAEVAAIKTLEAEGVVFVEPSPELLAGFKTSADKISGGWAKAVSGKYDVDAVAIVEEMRNEVDAASAK